MEQKPCMYCMPNPITLVGEKLLHHGANVQYGKLRVYFENEILERDIYFCPICGRKITDDDRIKKSRPPKESSPRMDALKKAFAQRFGVKKDGK